jgi:hypothetical protein
MNVPVISASLLCPRSFADPVELREVIRKQVEYYFSKDNLQHDPYLTNQMDANMSVPINVIMKVSSFFVIVCGDNPLIESLCIPSCVLVRQSEVINSG